MKLRVSNWHLFVAQMVSVSLLINCSAEKDEKNLCALSCSQSIVGSSELVIKPSVDQWNLACLSSANTAVELEPFLVQFDVYRQVEHLDGTLKKIPVANVAITPQVNGVLGSNQTNDELKDDSRFTGIKTGPSEWCTDSCGVFTMEVVPACVPGVTNEITVNARSGAAISEKPMIITVEDQTQTDSNSNN